MSATATGPTGSPVQLVYLDLQVRAVVICGCQPPGSVMVIQNQYKPVTCPLCQTEYWVDKIHFDLPAYYKEKGLDADVNQAPTQINVQAVQPTIIKPPQSIGPRRLQ